MFRKSKMQCLLLLALLTIIFTPDLRAQGNAAISVNLNQETSAVNPAWAFFGYDEPNYTYMKDGKKLLSEIAGFSQVPVYIRAHNLLTTGDGTAALKWGSTNAYTEDANGNPVYNWTITDSIFDVYVRLGLKPLAEIGFMPEALSVKPAPYRHSWKPGQPYNQVYTGWTYPPKDYQKWAGLVYEWVKHCVQRYGKKEVESWYWEVWNEPDISYWGGTQEEFLKLYDYSADAVKRALPTAKVGGSDNTGPSVKRAGDYFNAFLQHCISGTNYATGKKGAPLDLILFHAKGAPRVINGSVRMDLGRQLKDIEAGFKMIASYPETKNTPVIIGESDPEGCAACGMSTNPENAYRNGTLYSSYTAASFSRKYALAAETGINFLGAVSWSFEFENQPWFFGFRDLATNGVDKPVLNVFRMFALMRGKNVKVDANQMYPLKTVLDSGIRGVKADIGAMATKDKKTAAIMVWNYHDEDKHGGSENVMVNIDGLSASKVKITHYRIDSEHSNSYEAWKKMGSPQNPSAQQISELEKSGQLHTMSAPVVYSVNNSRLSVNLQMPRQGVSLLKLEW